MKGDEVLSGASILTLRACTLAQLTVLFERHLLPRPGPPHGFLALASHPADTQALLELQFVFDLVEVSGWRSQSAVKIFPFKSLKSLELKRLPAHRLEGLRGVYSQLESLLNVLRSLDLSHNKIQDCAEFLKPLSELEYLNLGYNSLQRAPLLAPSARAKLHTLILRNNELETINGIEQLSSLQHVDLAYNLLLEHSQLAPLALLHGLHTLTLEGNPLVFQKNHRMATVRHLSLQAAHLRLNLDGSTLTSSELSVLPQPVRLIGQSQAPPPGIRETERGAEEGSSGAGELSDSVSVGEVGVTRLRRKKARAKVKVRRASISEPSDTDRQPRPRTSSQDIVLPHQKDIERMDSFREQLGEDWLRYQHQLDVVPLSITSTTTHPLRAPEAPGAPEVPEVPEVPGDLPVDLCHPLLVGVLPSDDEEEEQEEQQEEEGVEEETSSRRSRSRGREVFLRVKQTLVVEVEVQRGKVLRRLDLDSLTRVEVTQNTWRREVREWMRKEEERRGEGGRGVRGRKREGEKERGVRRKRRKEGGRRREDRDRRRSYILLDNDPQHALQMLRDVLCVAAELNRQRDVVMAEAGQPSGPRRLQCLRCRAEFSQQGAASARGEDPRESRPTEEDKGNRTVCPKCGSDHVVDLAVQSAPSSSTPIKRAADPDSSALFSTPLNSFSDDLVSRDANLSSSPLLERTGSTTATCPRTLDTSAFSTTTAALQDSTSLFVTAQESPLLAGEDRADSWAEGSLCHAPETHGKEELAGSYCYASTGVSMAASGADQSGVDHPDRSSPDGELDVLTEEYEAVDHRLQLFLDMEVFEEEQEELHSFLKVSMVKFGQSGECPSLLVVSNQRLYFLEMTSHAHDGQLSEWLLKRDSRPITELCYLEVGLGSQAIHMAFQEGGVAYTLLVRDDARCTRFYGRLTGVVRELAPKSSSKLKSISTSRLHPQHHLWPLVCEDDTYAEGGHLDFFYLLAFLLQDNSWTPLTVLVTKETLYLLVEDHQWCKGPSGNGPDGGDNGGEGPSTGAATILESRPISCVSSAGLWPLDACRIDIQLYDETVKEERTWRLRSETPHLTAQLLSSVRIRWEAMFGVALATARQDATVS
ncbi:hypothetical protein NHX12_014828 [Muraenolepis orangiensis]|uniref:Serine/threonine-protein kinase 11-interacting protein n=1 Tax=Muraenolepis orangiensis TaxID=630683 RepID=A0A9Q0D993_9TELE|nr:hypothetical protein NHX12_014828 [Muraenolepis orangiensis]KAJ3584333.1 hypothetical protein NHX12_014828 [Muraenolepis orangiensis]